MPPVMPTAGRLRERVSWESVTRTRAPGGQAKPEYAAVCETWADVATPTGSERDYPQRQTDAVATHTITVRGNGTVPGLDTGWRATWRDRVLNVVSVLAFDTNDGEWLSVGCVENPPVA